MLAFHATIHARPAEAIAGPVVTLGNLPLATLSIAPHVLGSASFPGTFEEAMERLARLERMYCEQDGSFVWVSAQREPPWQVDGNLYDRAERLLFVDIKGSCPASEFDRLLACFGWPETVVMFQLVREAVLLDEGEFRRWCAKEN